MAGFTPITQDILRQLLDYDPVTGIFTWRPRPVGMFAPGNIGVEAVAAVWNKKNAGKRAFTHINSEGYQVGAIFGRGCKAHRIAWIWMTGEIPIEVDHEDKNRANNAFGNLRNVTKTGNQRNRALNANNSSGRVGVYFFKHSGRWVALIAGTYIGSYDTFDEAAAAREAAEKRLGFHEKHGERRLSAG